MIPEYREPSFGKSGKEHTMKQIGGIDPFIGLREYLSNCIDNVYLGFIPSVKVNVHIDKRHKKLVITDNGRGMSKTDLDHIIDEVGDSLKRFNDESIGEKGFGMLSFYGMGREASMIVYSRDKSTIPPRLNVLHWRTDIFKAAVYEISDIDKNPLLPGLRTGTKVLISGIHPQNFERYFLPSKISGRISEMYHPLIEAGKAEINLKYSGEHEKEEKIKKLEFRGEQIVIARIPYEYKDEETNLKKVSSMDIFLWYDPKNINGKIRLYNRGVFVKSLTGIEQFAQFPWDSGRLDGYINENFLKLTIHRNDYLPTQTFFDWTTFITKNYSDSLASKIRSGEEDIKEDEAIEIGHRLIRGIQDDYKDLCASFHILSGKFIKDSEGNTETVSPTGNETTGGGGRPEGSKDGGGSGGNGGSTPKDETKTKKELEEDKSGKRERVKPAKNFLPQFSIRLINFPEEESYLRSRIDIGFSRIDINKMHHNFTEVMHDSIRREEYYNERLSDEIGGYVYNRLIQEDKMSHLEASTFSRKLREESYYNGLKRIKKKKR